MCYMKRPSYSSPIRNSLRRFPKPERPFLDRLLARVKDEINQTYGHQWWEAATTTYGQLHKLRRQVRAASL